MLMTSMDMKRTESEMCVANETARSFGRQIFKRTMFPQSGWIFRDLGLQGL